jgi:hypothetical protein
MRDAAAGRRYVPELRQRVNDNLFRFEFGQTIAANFPNARLVRLEGETVMYDPRDVAEIMQAVDAFLPEP